jgi:hypothetical protein
VETFGGCVADTGSTTGQLITGGTIAAFMVLGLGVLGYLIYRHRERAKEVLLSFLSFEGALAFECAHRLLTVRRALHDLHPVRFDARACSICGESWDAVGDAFVFVQFRHAAARWPFSVVSMHAPP